MSVLQTTCFTLVGLQGTLFNWVWQNSRSERQDTASHAGNPSLRHSPLRRCQATASCSRRQGLGTMGGQSWTFWPRHCAKGYREQGGTFRYVVFAFLIVLDSPQLLVSRQKSERSQSWRIHHLQLGFSLSSHFLLFLALCSLFIFSARINAAPRIGLCFVLRVETFKKLGAEGRHPPNTRRRVSLALMSIHLIIC